MAKEFLGNGLRFPLLPDETGSLRYVSEDDNVEQSVRLVLLTALGERVMRPGFGTRARRMVFSPASVQNLRLLEVSIQEALRDWEPRVDVESVRAEADPAAPTRVDVDVKYRVRASNTRYNLVFPFYLGRMEA